MEWEKWTAMMEMAVLAKDGFEVRTLLRVKPLVIQPREPIYELEITGETKAKKRNPDIRNQEKKRVRERGPFCNNFSWDEADAKVRNSIFLCLGGRKSKPATTKTPGFEIHTISTNELSLGG